MQRGWEGKLFSPFLQFKEKMAKELPKQRVKYVKRVKWVFYAPGFLLNLVFGWYPLILGLIVGFQTYYLIRPSEFVGFTNFQDIFYDSLTPIVFRNTLYYTALQIGLVFFVPIIISILLMEMKKSTIRIMMILWFIPIAQMAGIIIWKWFYSVDYGLFNGILTTLGFPTSQWLNSARIAMLCLVLPGLIMFGPGLIYIATLQNIPQELYEAAELEGTSLWQKIWHITLPRLRPIIAMMMLLSIIGNMQVFTQPYVMTGGGPGSATYTIIMQVYTLSFTNLQFGKGGALALILFLLIMVLIIIQRKYFKENIDV